jgi:CheY-like chemotaxis protein
MVVSDPTQIHQIIMNLCTNAAHAMKHSGGTLRVSLLPIDLGPEAAARLPELAPGPYLQLSVADTGHGISLDIIDRIFDPYFTTKTKGEGTGLGLSVVHGIVKNHGGAIRVSSAPDLGATFDLWFPRCASAATLPQEDRKPIPSGTERILFVDDEPMVLKMGRELLERLGYSVAAETAAPAALEVFRASPGEFDLVITDKTMPVMTGFELARSVLAIRPDIPVILCTGFSDAEDPERARMLGIQELVMKPLVMREIAEKIRQVLTVARHQQ